MNEKQAKAHYYETIYPEHPVKEGEDLNLRRMQEKYLKKMWYNKQSYPYMESLATATGMSERFVYSLARKLNLPKRKEII